MTWSRLRRASAVATLLASAGCATLPDRPAPTMTTQPTAAFVPVPYPPPPGRVEFVPPAPSGEAIWIGGEWDYRFGRWAWTFGRWMVAPAGAKYARWSLRRDARGELWFAPGTWRDARGEVVEGGDALATGSARDRAVLEEDGTQQTVGPNLQPPPPSPRR